MASNNEEGYMDLALEQAEVALNKGLIPVGAVFVHDNRVIVHGRKNCIIHTLFDHAEHNGCYQALWSRDGPRNLQGCIVYSTLEPCVMCMSMLMTTRVSRIVYALEDPYGGGGFMLADPSRLPERFRSEHPTIAGGVLREPSRTLLRQFFLKQAQDGHWTDPD